MLAIEKPVVKVGRSKCVIIPKSWIESIERETGTTLQRVTLEPTDDGIMIKPAKAKTETPQA